MDSQASYRIACIDDEPVILELYDRYFSSDFSFYSTDKPDEFNQYVLENKPHVVLVDLVMPEKSGIELLEFISQRHDCIKFVVTGCSDGKILSKAEELSNRVYYKPLNHKTVIQDLKALLSLPAGS